MALKRIAGPVGFLEVDDAGTGGMPVVLVHSFAGSSAHWFAQLEHLRTNRRAIALDLRGHNHSDAPQSNDYAIESFAADLTAVVGHLDLSAVVLIGHSLGAAVAIAYAGKYAERVAGLMLVCAPGKIPAEQANQTVAALESDFEKVSGDYWSKLLAGAQPRVRSQIMDEMRRMPKDRSLRIIKEVFRYDPLPALSGYHGPQLAVVTAEDSPHDLHNLVRDLPYKRVTGTSHWPQMDKPHEFNRIMDEFLASIA